MQLIEIVFIGAVFALNVFIVVGSYMIQKREYWNHVGERLGKPKV